MRTTIEELVDSIRRPTTHYADQDFYDTDIEQLLKLVRIKTLEEYSNSLDPYHFSSLRFADYNIKELPDGFSKDSIIVDDPNAEYGCDYKSK